MLLKTIKSEGLAHNSYLLADGGEIAVIDPSRDVDRYLDFARNINSSITRIFETHRNEDYVSGALELKKRTGATVWRGASPDYRVPYAEETRDGQSFEFAKLRLRVLRTPGHTDDSISIAFEHLATGDTPIGVFTGDALFIGDVGRTDFYPDRARDVAGLLYDSIHRKLLPLGDQASIFPAHGSGSVCGSGIVEREFSTVGYERAHNPRLQLDRDAFIEAKVAEKHYQPPYFRRMEEANEGKDPELPSLPAGRAMAVKEFRDAVNSGGAQLLDLRHDQAIASGYLPGSYAIPLDMFASFGGWFLDWRRPLWLVLDRVEDYDRAARILVRMSFDKIEGFLAKGFDAWSVSAAPIETITSLDVHRLKSRLNEKHPPLVLDVRALDEFRDGHIDGALHVYVGEIEQRIDAVPADRPIVTICASGRRALVAAAALKRLGRDDVAVCWGSMGAWTRAGYPVAR